MYYDHISKNTIIYPFEYYGEPITQAEIDGLRETMASKVVALEKRAEFFGSWVIPMLVLMVLTVVYLVPFFESFLPAFISVLPALWFLGMTRYYSDRYFRQLVEYNDTLQASDPEYLIQAVLQKDRTLPAFYKAVADQGRSLTRREFHALQDFVHVST